MLSVLILCTYLITSSASFKIPKERTILILGDSHPECAVDDSIFTHAVNVAQSGAAYFYSYIKLRKLFDENPHIRTVLLSFHGSSIGKSKDEGFIGDKYNLNHLPNYFSLLHKEDVLALKNNPSFFSAILKTPIRSIRGTLKFIFKFRLTYKDLYIGGYQKLDRDRLQRAIALQKENELIQYVYSQYQPNYYLLKIIGFCKSNGVELILFNTPTYDSGKYGNKIALKNYYDTYLTGIKYLDYSDFPLPDYGYGDIGHLNYKGAEIFSNYLKENYEEIFFENSGKVYNGILGDNT
jgi:hypothetical protein